MSLDYSSASPRDIQERLDALNAQTSYTTSEANEISDAVMKLEWRISTNQATNVETSWKTLANTHVNIENAKKDLQIAKDRVNSLRNINKHSYYESWFPINRPLRNASKLVLLGLGIFFFVLTAFALLNSFGLHIHLNISWLNDETIGKLKILFPYGVLIIIVTLVVLTIVGFLRNP